MNIQDRLLSELSRSCGHNSAAILDPRTSSEKNVGLFFQAWIATGTNRPPSTAYSVCGKSLLSPHTEYNFKVGLLLAVNPKNT